MGLQRKIALRSQHYLMATQVIDQTDMAVTVPERFARRHNLHRRPAGGHHAAGNPHLLA